MMALIAGWPGTGIAEGEFPDDCCFSISSVNPCFGTMCFSCIVPERLEASVSVYSSDGRLVQTPFSGELEEGSNEFALEGLQPGLYLLVMRSGGLTASASTVILN